VKTLSDGVLTTLILVARPEETPLKEASRASKELNELGVRNQLLVLNGMLSEYDDDVSKSLYEKQQKALLGMSKDLKLIQSFIIPLRAYNITGVENVRLFLNSDKIENNNEVVNTSVIPCFNDVINDLYQSGKKVIFTMGKGGVGKTSIAASIAYGLNKKGKKVHLTTTDPAAHLQFVIDESSGITISRIDEKEELKKYQDEILTEAKKTMSTNDLAYVEEDLRSPCTQEIAVFRAFAEVVDKAEEQVVVIDTAPTGHTLLLLDNTQSYHKEIHRSQGNIPEAVRKLLPRLRNAIETEVIIVTLAEATPVYEALRLEEDLKRAGISGKWWIINSSFYKCQTTNVLLLAKAKNEIKWINNVIEHSEGNYSIIPWIADEIKADKLIL
jgi:arsenite-transporting ATPase